MTRPTRVLYCAPVAALGVSIAVIFVLQERAEQARLATERARRAVAEPWRESPDWRGTEISGSAPAAVEQAFRNDPPAPETRRIFFDSLLRHSVGWYATVESVAPDGDGWNVALSVSPRMRPVWHTTAKTDETWHVSANGRARCDHCESGGPFDLMRD